MKNEAAAINARLTDEARDGLRTRIDLDAFLAAGNDRGAQWRGWDRTSKMDAVIQMLDIRGIDWTGAMVDHWIARYDEKWENGQRESDLVIPPAAAILEVLTDSISDARRHEDFGGVRQLDRVRMNIVRGARLCWVRGDLLIASINHPGTVYSVNRAGCSCPNGAAGRAQCWHVALFDTLLAMLDTEAETADMEADPDPPIDIPDEGPNPTPGGPPAPEWRAPWYARLASARNVCWAAL